MTRKGNPDFKEMLRAGTNAAAFSPEMCAAYALRHQLVNVLNLPSATIDQQFTSSALAEFTRIDTDPLLGEYIRNRAAVEADKSVLRMFDDASIMTRPAHDKAVLEDAIRRSWDAALTSTIANMAMANRRRFQGGDDERKIAALGQLVANAMGLSVGAAGLRTPKDQVGDKKHIPGPIGWKPYGPGKLKDRATPTDKAVGDSVPGHDGYRSPPPTPDPAREFERTAPALPRQPKDRESPTVNAENISEPDDHDFTPQDANRTDEQGHAVFDADPSRAMDDDDEQEMESDEAPADSDDEDEMSLDADPSHDSDEAEDDDEDGEEVNSDPSHDTDEGDDEDDEKVFDPDPSRDSDDDDDDEDDEELDGDPSRNADEGDDEDDEIVFDPDPSRDSDDDDDDEDDEELDSDETNQDDSDANRNQTPNNANMTDQQGNAVHVDPDESDR